MLLDIKTHKIKYLGFDYRKRPYGEKLEPIQSFKDYFPLYDLRIYPKKSYFNNYYLYNKSLNPTNATAIFLGDLDSIYNIIDKKGTIKDFSNIKKVYFDPCCKFPRFKLNGLSNIKKTNNLNNADVVIVDNKISLNSYSTFLINGFASNKCLITYSRKEDCYYLLDWCPPSKLYSNEETNKYYTYLNKYTNSNISCVQEFKSVLVKSGVLPFDVREVYYGNIILMNDLNKISCIKGIIKDYDKIAFSSDLDKYISKESKIPSDEELKSMIEMIESSDESTKNIGVKLLSLSNIDCLSSTIGCIIIHNWNNIKHLSSTKSVVFKQTLNTIGLNSRELNYYNNSYYINKLYKKASTDLDKQKVKEFIQRIAFKRLKEKAKEITGEYDSIPLNIDFTIS